MKPRRIAFLSPDCLATMSNGTITYLTRITRALQQAGHEPEIFCVSHLPPGSYDFYGIRVHSVRRQRSRMSAWIRRSGEWLNNEGLETLGRSLQSATALANRLHERDQEAPFDAVHCIDEGLTGLFVRPRSGRPVATFCQYDRRLWMRAEGAAFTPADRLLALMIRRGIRRADVVYAHSRYLRDHLCRKYGIRAHVFRPPVFRERIAAPSTPRGLPARYLIHFGLLGRRKGTDLVARALPLVWREAPEVTMVWAGSMRSDPRPIMARYRRQWGTFADRVTWLGPLAKPALYAVVKNSIAAVLPSRADNLPNTVTESLLFEVPVIAFDGASLDEMLDHGTSGDLVRDGDVRALADAMLRAWRGQIRFVRPPAIFAEMEPRRAAAAFLRLLGFEPTGGVPEASRIDTAERNVLRIHDLQPAAIEVGQGFNVQPDGRSVFSIACENAGLWTAILLNDEQLETTYGSPSWVTAFAPAGLVDRPGRHRIRLVDEFRGASNEIEFIVGGTTQRADRAEIATPAERASAAAG